MLNIQYRAGSQIAWITNELETDLGFVDADQELTPALITIVREGDYLEYRVTLEPENDIRSPVIVIPAGKIRLVLSGESQGIYGIEAKGLQHYNVFVNRMTFNKKD